VRALHLVVVRQQDVKGGAAVFAGTRVTVRSLLEHLDRGLELEAFLQSHPELPRELVSQALALGLEALLQDVPMERGQPQRSLLPRVDAAGAIINAEELSVDQVVGKKVRCPGCRMLVFRSWPEGWDAHAASRCRGVPAGDPEWRKAEFKRRYAQLFRSP
jgi:uncharacterized protein (DUF433 family)